MRILGKSELSVNEIGLGCWAIGGPSFDDQGQPVGWAGNDDKKSLAGLTKAWEVGINHWDTADVYGKGHSERLIGKVFRESVKRADIVLASKVGWFKGTAAHPFEPLHIRQQLEQSLQNLGTDHLDIYYLHNPFFGENDEYLEPAAETMQQLKAEGKIRVIGQSAYSFADFQKVVPVVQPDVLQLPYNALHSPFDHPENDIFRWADERNLGLVLFGTYAKGVLLGKYDPSNPPKFDSGDIRARVEEFQPEYLLKLEKALNQLRNRFGTDQAALARAAIQFALSRSKNAVAIPGFKNAGQVEQNAATGSVPLSDEDLNFMAAVLADFKS